MEIRRYTDRELLELHERREQTFSVTLRGQRRHAILFEPYNISHTEYRVLALLFFSHGCEPSVMADKLLILRQTMTKVIDSLEAKGYAVRTVHPYDRRKLFINLLPEGKKIARELLCLESDYIDRVDSQFTQEELDVYHALAGRIQHARESVMQEILEERSKES
jgi:MarR family 2-MHQ and catechol resistance regulon transcriptional repressor